MTYTDFQDLDELTEARPIQEPLDPVSQAVGSRVYVRRHRFANLYLLGAVGRSPRLPVSRYYWDAEPPVAVDFVREVRHGEQEAASKRKYCERLSIRYVICAGEFDGERVEQQLGRAAVPEAPPAAEPAAPEANRPRTAPRRRRSKPSR